MTTVGNRGSPIKSSNSIIASTSVKPVNANSHSAPLDSSSKREPSSEAPPEKRRGRPKGAKNKKPSGTALKIKPNSSTDSTKPLPMSRCTDSIRESILEKLHVELFGNSSSLSLVAPAPSPKKTICLKSRNLVSGKSRGRPRTRPLLESKRVPFQNVSDSISFATKSIEDAVSNTDFNKRLAICRPSSKDICIDDKSQHNIVNQTEQSQPASNGGVFFRRRTSFQLEI